MRILAIRGKNLASLAGEFEVDFQQEPLLSAGLFAISGPTGAGKSTLLDALCLALFDDTPRLKGADARGIELPDVGAETTLPNDRRNILRRGTAEGYAEVDFLGNDGVGYRSRWSVRRAHGKAERKLQNAEMSIIRIDDQQPVGGHLKSEVVKTIVEKIGLSFEQFTRAVLLAQNEFFTFLKASDDERAALLQTLTGTDRFEILSRRAFERHKGEQEKLRLVRERLADQQPLSAEERLLKQGEQLETKVGIEAQSEREKLLAGHLRWYQELEKALKRESDAQAELEKAVAQRDAAVPRRAHFEQVEAVREAKPLVDEGRRLEKVGSEITVQLGAALETAALSARHSDTAKTAWESAGAALSRVEGASRQFAPLIEQARQIDTEVAARRAAHESTDKVHRGVVAALAQANNDLDGNRRLNQAKQGQLQAARAWLAEHGHLQSLAEGWMRWDTLFAAAGEEQQHVTQADQELLTMNRQGQQQTLAFENGQARLAAAVGALQASEGELQKVVFALKDFDAEALAQARADLEKCKEALQHADQVWRERGASMAQLATLASETNEINVARAAAEERLNQVRAQRPLALATVQQAERDWRVVFEASQENVGALREQLQADAPCPVCGALEHPYVAHNPALDNALARLQGGLERCRQTLNDLEIEEKSQSKHLENLAARLEQIKQRRALLDREQENMQVAWQQAASRLTALFGALFGALFSQEAADVAAWLTSQFAMIQEEARYLSGQETKLRQAATDRQKVQERLNAARKTHEALKDEVVRLKAAADGTLSATQAKSDYRASALQRQATALEQLDQAHPDPGWRTQWASDPQQYHAACRKDAAQWSAQKKAEELLLAEIANLEATAQALSTTASKAAADHRQASQALAEIAGQLQERQAARRKVFAGMELPAHPEGAPPGLPEDLTVQQIETHLTAAIVAARQQQADAQDIFKKNEQQLAVQQERRAQLAKQLEAIQAEARQAAASLAGWLETFNAGRPEDAPLDSASLNELLAFDAAWIVAERQALAQLDTAIATAGGGLAQMRGQRLAHENAPPTADTPETVQANLDQVAATLNGLREKLGGIELALRRDDEIKHKASELLNILAAQEKTARLWAQMNDLIGAADGKKFRNYAQQLTLDILIGYANAHLKDLSRRYRLSRVKDSLALMVIDQDMGDEYRSVHSLSGGESFLVSLALALGLASLSSHRVRVESLFIDEGFGSLDADTLRVAMDALDSLQAMGRKVGVISHVQEMTERIGTCVQVKRLSGGKSQVVVAGL